jgi:hypothetical protein
MVVPDCRSHRQDPLRDPDTDVYRAELRDLTCELLFCGWSGCSSVFVDRAAEDAVAVDWGVEGDDGGGVVVGWAVFASLVWAVVIEMSGELVDHRDGVVFVVDEHSVGALGSDAAHESLGVAVGSGVCGGIFTMSMLFEANTVSNDAVCLVSRSRMGNRNRVMRSSRFIRRLRAACVVQAAVGCAVTPRMWTRRV